MPFFFFKHCYNFMIVTMIVQFGMVFFVFIFELYIMYDYLIFIWKFFPLLIIKSYSFIYFELLIFI